MRRGSFRADYLPPKPQCKVYFQFYCHAESATLFSLLEGPPPPAFRLKTDRWWPHPQAYDVLRFWERGRILADFQIVYVTRGEGSLETATRGAQTLRAGHAFLLFPGEWHRYHPAPEAGWDEHWLGFDGDSDRLLRHNRVISPAEPVFDVGADSELMAAFARPVELVKLKPPGLQQTLAALVLEILGRISSAHRLSDDGEPGLDPIVREARLWLAERLDEPVDLAGLASHLGVSYSALRRAFKLRNGFALHQYQLELRVSEAKKLLADTGLPVKTIADQFGFQSANYFSRRFKTKTGLSPEAWRHQAHGGDHLALVATRPKPQRKPGSPAS